MRKIPLVLLLILAIPAISAHAHAHADTAIPQRVRKAVMRQYG